MSSLTIPTTQETEAAASEPTTAEVTHCDLDQLMQPRYFAGQLLTDEDLTAHLRWGQDKFRLGRYRDGWGVVCGLAVHCDPQQTGYVVVKPGYAIDSCGDDIIVCRETAVDLREVCRDEPPDCHNLKQPAEKEEERQSPLSFGGYEVPAEDVRVVDLYVRYAEKGARPVSALGRSRNGDGDNCEYSRMIESYVLHGVRAQANSNPVTEAAKTWHDLYNSCQKLLLKFAEGWAALLESGAEAIREKLLAYIDTHHFHQFCYLHNYICDLSDEELLNRRLLARVLFLIVQDCRNAFLNRPCSSGTDVPGVRLARIWLKRVELEDDKGYECHVLAIDTYPPYRRPLQSDTWKAPTGMINGGQVIWQRPEEACCRLEALGIRVATESRIVPFVEEVQRMWEQLQQAKAEETDRLPHELFLSCHGGPIRLQVVDLGVLGQRVIGFEDVERRDWPPREDDDPESEDELTEIDGIGTERAAKLREAGIFSFSRLGRTRVEVLKELFPRVGVDALELWIKQARDRAYKR